MIAALCDMLVQFDRESKASNIEIAIAGYKMILNIFDRKSFSKEWAMTQISLGATYRNRIQGDQAENLELSLECYRNALEVYTLDTSPIQWADIQNNLANTYRDLANIYRDHIQKNPAVNLERAIACCCNALTVYFRFSRWEAWADTQNNLGLIYQDLGQINEAISCFQLALEIFKPNIFPLKCKMSGVNLGNTAFADRRWAKAIEGYDVAIKAVEQSRTWSSNDSRRREITSEAMEVYVKAVQACINKCRDRFWIISQLLAKLLNLFLCNCSHVVFP